MNVKSINTKVVAEMGRARIEYEIKGDGTLGQVTGQAYNEQGQLMGTFTRNADGAQSVWANANGSVAEIAQQLSAALAWIAEHPQPQLGGEDAEPENEQ